MCGIAGIVHLSKNEIPLQVSLRKMTDSMRHRGPDDEGYAFFGKDKTRAVGGKDTPGEVWCSRLSYTPALRIEEVNGVYEIGLGHRRLSIIDLAPTGHQPMCSEDGELWIVYNGEIYNYVELREDLRKVGYHFRTNTDTEVLLLAYREWGEQCLRRLNGMWAFVIYDRTKNILFGARDRFGVKPLYYYLDPNVFAFASEMKALVRSSFVKTGINPCAVFDYLAVGWVENEEEGFFKNILEIEPSTAFCFDLPSGAFRKWNYYALAYTERWERFDERDSQQHAGRVKELIFDAVTLRLRSDVPIGSCLSGGLDSSTIVCVINQLLHKGNIEQIGEKQRVFTASYPQKDADESKWAQIIADHTMTSWYQTFPGSKDLLEDLEDIAYAQDIPFGSTSMFAQYRVMKLAQEAGVKVVLDGQGGDEVFGGYRGYYRILFGEMVKHGAIKGIWRELRSLNQSCIDHRFLLSSSLKLWGGKIFPVFVIEAAMKRIRRESSYLNPDFWVEYRYRLEGLRDKAATSLNQALYESLTGFEFKNLLRFEDRNSMRFSIEARTPFADDLPLIEYLFQLPAVYKIHCGWSKYLMRESTRGILPEEIRSRRDKVGFATPENDWLSEIKDDLGAYLQSDQSGYLNIRQMKKDWDSFFAASETTSREALWRLINFAVWKKVYGL